MNVVRGNAQAFEQKGLTVMKSHDTKLTAQVAAVGEQGATVAPVKVTSKKDARPKKGAPKTRENAKRGKSKAPAPKKAGGESAKAPRPAKEPRIPREGSKMATVIAMISKKGGATLDAIMKETGWQAHTCRGFMSTLTRGTGVAFTSTRRESDKARVYEVMGAVK
jgi:hypothetical protein